MVRNWNVASFIKEFVVAIPEEMTIKQGLFKLKSHSGSSLYDIISAHPEEHPGDANKFQPNGTFGSRSQDEKYRGCRASLPMASTQPKEKR